MAGAILNKQPIFTAIPILVTKQFDPEVLSTLRDPGMREGTEVYVDETTFGSLITKVTVVSTGLVGSNVTTKVIYLGIQDSNSGVRSLYQSKIMTGITTLTTTDIVPYVTFTFDGGLVMYPSSGRRLYIAASTNRATTNQSGDEISVIVEGGTYDQPE
jgi:hypothetical protein